MLLNASGKHKWDAYLLNPDTFDEGYFIVPFNLAAVQERGESSTPLLCMLINIRLTFSIGDPTLQVMFFLGRHVKRMHDTESLRIACQPDPIIHHYFLNMYSSDEVPCQAPLPIPIPLT